jgi:hypothetical protein
VLSALAANSNIASAEDAAQPTAASAPACSAGLRLSAVQYDPNHAERSFAVFAGSRVQPLRHGARVGSGYAIERIEQGAVVLSSVSQRCVVRLRGAVAERGPRAIPVDQIRSAAKLRHQPTQLTQTTPAPSTKVGS